MYRMPFRMEHSPLQKPQFLRAENPALISSSLFSQPFHHVNLKQCWDNNLFLSSLPTAMVLKTFCICSVDVSDNINSLLQHIICVHSELTVFQGFALHIGKYIGIKFCTRFQTAPQLLHFHVQHQHIVHMENIKYKVVNLSSLEYTDYFYQSLSIIKQLNSDNVYSLYTIYMSVLLSSA